MSVHLIKRLFKHTSALRRNNINSSAMAPHCTGV